MLAAPEQLLPGFPDPVFDSQRVFRAVLRALAEPGAVQTIAPEVAAPKPLAPATAAVCLALFDFETPVWLQSDSTEVSRYLRFHCGCPLTREREAARFGVVDDAQVMPALSGFAAGTAEYPDRSATLLVQALAIGRGEWVRLSGPGIRETAEVALSGVRADFWREWNENAQLFPRGIDVIFIAGRQVVGLPRTVRAEV